MDQTLRLSVEEVFEDRKARYPNLTSREIVASILSEFEKVGHASRYVRKDGEIGWRATDKMREDLFERMQEVMDDQEETNDDDEF
ncbi:MAG: hypothetical protein WBF07_03310 [Xanthobacteraceae bacterium]